MKNFSFISYLSCFLCCCLLSTWVGLAQENKPITNDDILQMVQAGFEEETIIKAVQANDLALDTSVQGLIALKNAGLSEETIATILEVKATRGHTPPNDEGGFPELQRDRTSEERDQRLPAIYVTEVSSDGSLLASSDTALEAIKTLQQKGMRVVIIKEKADYILQITRQLGKRSWSKDTKIVLSNREGEVVETRSTRSIGGAMGDVVDYIKKHHQ